MNSGMKRLLSMLMALVMVFAMFAPVSASAAGTAASNQTVEITVGESTKLNVPGVYARINWTTSDNGVAKVSGNGTVTGVAPGTAVIKATYKTNFGFWGRTKTTSFSVVVTAPEAQAVTVEEGQTLQLTVNAKGGKVAWNSSDSRVATVGQNGQVRGIAPGTATVTAKITRFMGFFGKKTETVIFEVTVTAAPEEEAPEALTVTEGETLQLTVNAKGGKVAWKSSDKRIATVDSKGLVKGIREGNVTVTATITKTSGHRFPWQRPGKPVTEVVKFEITVLPAAPVINYFTVTFQSNGGSEVAPQTIEEGMTVAEPEAPALEGYTFMGWYADEALTAEYDFAAAVTSDIILYAKWEENEPPRPTMPENPSAADEYIWSTSDVVDVIPAEESEDVPTEVEVIDLLTERGFDSYPVVYEHTINGDYVEETEISAGTTDKHPMYYTYYVSANRELWLIYVVNGMVMANPVSFNLQSALPAELVVSESEALTSYDDVGNQFYVNIPYESAVIVKTVGRIDAETLDGLTIEEINKL